MELNEFIDAYLEKVYAGDIDGANEFAKETYGDEIPEEITNAISAAHEARQAEMVEKVETLAEEAGCEVEQDSTEVEPAAEEVVEEVTE